MRIADFLIRNPQSEIRNKTNFVVIGLMFHYLKPDTLNEALMLLVDEKGRYPLLAGGTDLLVQWKSTSTYPSGIIDIGKLEELMLIIERENTIEIGSLVTHSTMINSKIVTRCCPTLAAACETIGAIQIQNRGTIGGNIVTASPAGDLPPVLMAFDAVLELTHLGGSRRVPIREFYLSYRNTALQPNEILTKIIIPKQRADERSVFYKVGTRKAQAISKVALCVRSLIIPPNPPLEKGGADRNSPLWKRGGGGDLMMQNGVIEDIAIALGSVAPTVIRAPNTEGYLKGKKLDPSIIEEARKMLSTEVVPIDDIRSTADYRRFVAGNLLARYLNELTSPL